MPVATAFREQSLTATGSSATEPPSVVSAIVAAVFSLAMIPAWLYALQNVAPEDRTLATVLCVVYAGACVFAVPLSQRLTLPAQVCVCVTLLALGVAFVALSGLTNSWVLLCALGVVATLMPIAVTVFVVAVTAASLLILAWVTGTVTDQFPNIVIIVAVTAAAALIVNLIELNADLKEARGQIAALAVAKERERLARDLHDILGHSLTTVALKAGLARRVLEAGKPAQAEVQIRDVERLVQQSLTDLRATVSDFKEITLATELAIAAEALRAAGLEADLPTASDDVDPRLQGVFGFVLREAITNVIRHASARTVVVRLTTSTITVSNDGPRGEVGPAGHGLHGLEERMAAVGGTLRAGPGPRGGFVVVASGAAEPETGTAGTGLLRAGGGAP